MTVHLEQAGMGANGAGIPELKLQHWRGFPDKNGWKAAPMLEFGISVVRRSEA